MKIIILSDANSIHTARWAKSLTEEGIHLIIFSLFSQTKKMRSFYQKNGIKVVSAQIERFGISKYSRLLVKPLYLLALVKLKKTINSFSPDLMHAHYASSYGLLAALSNFKPYCVSVWGDDVFIRKNHILIKFLLKNSFKKSDKIFSTSNTIDRFMRKEFKIETTVIPFGVDTSYFKPIKSFKKLNKIGIIKSLEPYNGIKHLIDAFSLVLKKNIINVELMIVGEGSCEGELKKYVKDLNLTNSISFEGQIEHEKIVSYYNELSLFACPSIRESFGVSIIEASACGVPVIANNVGGIKDLIDHGKTGYLINTSNTTEFAKYIENLILDDSLIKKQGENGRNFVKKNYEWKDSVETLVNNYKNMISKE